MDDLFFDIVEEAPNFSIVEETLAFDVVEEIIAVQLVEEIIILPQVVEEIHVDIVEESITFVLDGMIAPSVVTVGTAPTLESLVPPGQTVVLETVVVGGWFATKWSVCGKTADNLLQVSEVSALPYDPLLVDWSRYNIHGSLIPMTVFCTRDAGGDLILSATNHHTEDLTMRTIKLV